MNDRKDTSEPVRVTVVIAGRVQGVGFRWWAAQRARSYGLTGWIRNDDNGHVMAVAEGPQSLILSWFRLLREGPTNARVEHVTPVFSKPTSEFRIFEIR